LHFFFLLSRNGKKAISISYDESEEEEDFDSLSLYCTDGIIIELETIANTRRIPEPVNTSNGKKIYFFLENHLFQWLTYYSKATANWYVLANSNLTYSSYYSFFWIPLFSNMLNKS
jgi:hypothetical protein